MLDEISYYDENKQCRLLVHGSNKEFCAYMLTSSRWAKYNLYLLK